MRWALAALLACVGCSHPSPSPLLATSAPRPVGRVTFTVDVGDHVQLCLQTTFGMRFDDPNLPDLVCAETVGDLRDRAVRLRAAQ